MSCAPVQGMSGPRMGQNVPFGKTLMPETYLVPPRANPYHRSICGKGEGAQRNADEFYR